MRARSLVMGARVLGAGSAVALLLAGCAYLGGEQAATDSPSSAQNAEPAFSADLLGMNDALPFSPPPLPDVQPAQPANLWERIRAGFALPAADKQPLVQHEIDYFAAQQAYLDRVAERARPYLSYIVQSLEHRGMPTEVALLPIVESAFRPFAYSSGQAAGIWQFIPATAQLYGLQQNWWYDGRRDVIAATQAALDYLQRLNELFNGDWLLTIAAYNAGEGTVLRAIKHNAARGRPTDFWHLDLPRETETYVPRLLALRSLVAAPKEYGLELPNIPDEPQIEVVKVNSQIDLALAARLAGVSVAELYRLNPGYNRWATAPDGPHRLVLPVDRVEQFKKGLAAIPPNKRVHWRRHHVTHGDTLNRLAQRYHTTVAVLKNVNDLHGNLIRTGSHLIVPLTSQPSAAYAFNPLHSMASSHKVAYIVRRGDSLWRIARAHHSTVARIRRWNHLARGAVLRPGQKLVLWQAQPAMTVELGSLQASLVQSVRYTVQPGDSLYRIARRFNVTVDDLRQWNDLPEGRYLQPGQKLQLKVDVTRLSDSS